MALKNRNNFPPGGFAFFQPETGWSAPSHIGFDAVVQEIIRHRQSNPRFNLATDIATVEIELENYTSARLESMPGGVDYIIPNSPAPPPGSFIHPPRRSRAAGGVAVANKVKAGVSLIVDFLGPSMKAVAHDLAEQRATVCVTCPNNQPGALLAGVLSEGLRLLLEAKSEMKLTTSHDANLKSCSACECNLKLKPHVELEYIWSRLTPNQAEKLTPFCWILMERDNAKAN